MQEHKEWLAYAEMDLGTAKLLLISPHTFLLPALYHTQQCAEKALKAFLVFKDINPEKVHDLIRLINKCMQIDQEFSVLKCHAVELNPYISGARYPDSCLPMPHTSTVEASIKSATIILEFVKGKITF
jgi:HEPN domain-containing protein